MFDFIKTQSQANECSDIVRKCEIAIELLHQTRDATEDLTEIDDDLRVLLLRTLDNALEDYVGDICGTVDELADLIDEWDETR